VLGEAISKALLLNGSAPSSAHEYLLVTGTPEGSAVDAHLPETALFT